MGKLGHDPEIHHFSHPHPLHLSQLSSTTPACSACTLPLSTTAVAAANFFYTCTTCNFSLHVSCTQFPQLITHPSHPNHPLSLLPTTAYSEGHFECDACKCRGNGFSYHCGQCYFDLHVTCASKPLSVTNSLHPHPLGLTFSSPYEKKWFSCDICRKIGTQQWFYRCVPCEFDVHLECVNSKPAAAPPLLQHQHLLPTLSQNQTQQLHGNQIHLTHSASAGGQLQSYPPAAVAAVEAPPLLHQHHHSSHAVSQNQTQQLHGNQIHLTHSASTGGRLQSYPPAAVAAVEAPPPLHQHHHSSHAVSQNQNQIQYENQNHFMHSASTGGRLQNNYPPAAGVGLIHNGGSGNANANSDLANMMVTSMATPPPPLHHHHSLPAVSHNGNQMLYGNQNHLMHSASTGGRLQNNYPSPAAAAAVAPPPQLQHHRSLPPVSQNRNHIMYGNQTHLMHSVSMGGQLQNYYHPAAAAGVGAAYIGGNANIGNNLANTSGIIQGAVQQVGLKFVQGAVQQVGESFMESLIGGVGDGGGDVVVSVLEGVLDSLC